VRLFPGDPDLGRFGAVSYLGIPFLDRDGTILGHLAVLDTKALPADPRTLALFRLFADRASAELRRLRAETSLREREEALARLLDGAMDAIVELDGDLRVTQLNAAARKVLDVETVGHGFRRHLSVESGDTLESVVRRLADDDGPTSLWIPAGLEAVRSDGRTFSAEATISRHERDRRTHFTLVLRDVNDRLEAERTIETLRRETEVLREEIRATRGFDEIVGESAALVRVLGDVEQVAGTDASVLLTGETGTGKELFARAIHAASPRRQRALVTVNCAAIPTNLIESEFFGHEKGAFTGATRRREGRFALADGGTIFLDEVGELPVDLQAKLLRVLQEGEFAPVGSSRTRQVDVRVIAATNRDLLRCAREGRFREDLYYRLAVFPIALPPLRERPEDIPLLAQAFARRFASRTGRRVDPLVAEDLHRLQSYDWPGNVRELANVIERATIVSRNGRLDLDRALPAGAAACGPPESGDPARILTERELRERERANLVRALEASDWRVAGDGGAASRLGLPPSTLSSRMRSLGVRRPS
jgi:PAS domain S-box-containing protein